MKNSAPDSNDQNSSHVSNLKTLMDACSTGCALDTVTSFTIIELLVVISIIAVLVTLLLPALKSAKSHGEAIGCLSNLKQIAIGTYGYCDDNGGTFPLSRKYASGEPKTTDWHIQVDAYVTKTLKTLGEDWTTGYNENQVIPIWNCATDGRYPIPWNYSGQTSYFGNWYLFRQWDVSGGVETPAWTGKTSTKCSQITNPARTLMSGHWTRGYYTGFKAQAKKSYLHWTNSWRRYANNTQTAYPRDPNGIDYSRPNFHLYLHSRRASYLAVDGHAEKLDKEAISDYINASYDDGRGEMYFVPPPSENVNW